MNEEEVRRMAEDWLKDREEMTQLNLRCDELAKRFKAGEFVGLKPLWHVKKDDIDLSKQKHPLDEKYFVNGYTILPEIDFDQLLDSFHSNQGSFLNDKKILNRNGFVDNQLCRIIEHWQNGEALVPPIIIFNEGLKQNWPADGKHRMKVAYYLGVKKIPIIVPNIHLEQVSALLL